MLVLTVPVTLWLAWWEATRHATPGKRVFGLQVVGDDDVGGRGVSLRQAVLRSAVKVTLPWELGHAALWQTWDRRVTGLAAALFVLAYVVVGMQFVLLFRGGRPIHDRLARTVVRSA